MPIQILQFKKVVQRDVGPIKAWRHYKWYNKTPKSHKHLYLLWLQYNIPVLKIQRSCLPPGEVRSAEAPAPGLARGHD